MDTEPSPLRNTAHTNLLSSRMQEFFLSLCQILLASVCRGRKWSSHYQHSLNELGNMKYLESS